MELVGTVALDGIDLSDVVRVSDLLDLCAKVPV